jgi:hypothetical protein
MTVKELCDELAKYPDDMLVVLEEEVEFRVEANDTTFVNGEPQTVVELLWGET